MSIDYLSTEAKMDSSFATLRSFSTKSSSSKCAKAIILPVCSWNYEVYVIYDTDGCVASSSE